MRLEVYFVDREPVFRVNDTWYASECGQKWWKMYAISKAPADKFWSVGEPLGFDKAPVPKFAIAVNHQP